MPVGTGTVPVVEIYGSLEINQGLVQLLQPLLGGCPVLVDDGQLSSPRAWQQQISCTYGLEKELRARYVTITMQMKRIQRPGNIWNNFVTNVR